MVIHRWYVLYYSQWMQCIPRFGEGRDHRDIHPSFQPRPMREHLASIDMPSRQPPAFSIQKAGCSSRPWKQHMMTVAQATTVSVCIPRGPPYTSYELLVVTKMDQCMFKEIILSCDALYGIAPATPLGEQVWIWLVIPLLKNGWSSRCPCILWLLWNPIHDL